MRKFGNKEKMYMQTVLATVPMPDSDSDEDEAAREFLPENSSTTLDNTKRRKSGQWTVAYIPLDMCQSE